MFLSNSHILGRLIVLTLLVARPFLHYLLFLFLLVQKESEAKRKIQKFHRPFLGCGTGMESPFLLSARAKTWLVIYVPQAGIG